MIEEKDQLAAVTRQRDAAEDALVQTPAVLLDAGPEEMVNGVLRIVSSLVDAAFGLYVPAQSDAVVSWPPAGEVFAEVPEPGRAPLLLAAVHKGEVARIEDLGRYGATEEALRHYGLLRDGKLVRSWLALPVGDRETRFGTLVLGDAQPRAFGDRDERLALALARHLGVALTQAEVLRERTRIAVALQSTLLPPVLPAIPGVDLAARYRAAGPENVVGGDFYDIFEMGPGNWGLVLGDVSGVGPEAAAITGLARYTVRAVAHELVAPSSVLASLNEALVNYQSGERFCSAVFLKVSQGGQGTDIVVARAGHPPLLVLRDDGTVEEPGADPGMLLGLFPEICLRDAGVHLGPGDMAVLYTDGVIEARDPQGEQFGAERVAAVLSQSAGRTADGVARRLELAVRDFGGGEVADDMAILVARCLPGSVQAP